MVARLVENAYFKLTSVVAVVVFAIGASFTAGRAIEANNSFKQEIKRDVEDIRSTIASLDKKIVGNTKAGWHRVTMEKWVLLARTLNPSVVLPDPWDELFDPRPDE